MPSALACCNAAGSGVQVSVAEDHAERIYSFVACSMVKVTRGQVVLFDQQADSGGRLPQMCAHLIDES